MTNNILFITLLIVTVALTILAKKLTWAGAFTGAFLAIAIYLGTGFSGVALLGSFFIMGTLVTSWRSTKKVALGLSKENESKRNMWQVIANGGVAGLCGIVAAFIPGQQHLMLLTLASALSAAAADTSSSELGSLYGKKFYNIITLKADKRGENGVVSFEGFLFGIASTCVISSVYIYFAGWSPERFLTIIAAGTSGNIMDSVAGATFERNGRLNNNGVNFLNTLTAAIISLAIWATLL